MRDRQAKSSAIPGSAQGGRALRIVLLSVSVIAAGVCAALLLRSRQQISVVRLATGEETGEYYAFGEAIAQVTQKHAPNLRIEVLVSPGSTQNMDSVQAHTSDMALVQSDTPVQPAVQAVAQLYPEIFHLIANRDANITSMADLKGKRVALMPVGSGSYQLFWPLAGHYDLSAQDLTAQPLAPADAYAALPQGEGDALFRIIGLGNPAIGELLKTGQFDLVPIEQIGALKLTQPYLEPTVIPQGSYDGGAPIYR
ncbi:TAXI family TRAP transporter solute-binding subunit [Leptolyngbya sp. BC1307]|uniref:TAXI family TRAP transporter solute-binding subunit n=1 Tax=Leptolyngbya sp. BC1307 TaxID=2029589 RepID=UPI001F0AEB5E|nr:TAXI family TRAP transporter solute-binding subunit [Leptolyngbya sp. BC1307]